MGLKYICSGSTYDISGPEHEPVSDKKHRLNYVVSGSTKQIGLATNSSCTKYSPLRIKTQTTIDGNNVSAFYIGRSESSSASEKLTYTSATLGYQWIETWTQSSYTYTNGNKSTTGTTYQTRSSTSRYDYSIKVSAKTDVVTYSITSYSTRINKWFSTSLSTARYYTISGIFGFNTGSSTVNSSTYDTFTKLLKDAILTATNSLKTAFTYTTMETTSSLPFNVATYTTNSTAYTSHPLNGPVTFTYTTNNTTSFLDTYYTCSSTSSTRNNTYTGTVKKITTNSSSASGVGMMVTSTEKYTYYNWNVQTVATSISSTIVELAHYSTGGNVTSANASQTTSSNTTKAYTRSSTSGTVYGTQYITYTQNSYTYTQEGPYWVTSTTFTNASQAKTTSFTNGSYGSATASYVDTTSYTVSSSSSQSTHNFV